MAQQGKVHSLHINISSLRIILDLKGKVNLGNTKNKTSMYGKCCYIEGRTRAVNCIKQGMKKVFFLLKGKEKINIDYIMFILKVTIG